MKLVNQYIIPFSGLKEGEHEFEFIFDQKFFDEHEVLSAKGGNIKANILFLKKKTMFTLETEINGTMEIQCDRCLEYFNFPIRFRGNLVVKFGENTNESTDEIWVIHPNEYELNIEQYLFECIGLSLPIQRVHPEDDKGNLTCDPEMLERIVSFSSGDDDKNDDEEIDPRWNALKDLLNDTNNN